MLKFALRVILKLALIATVIFTFLVFGNLYTYQRLTDEEPIAQLIFTPINFQEFDATLRHGNFCEQTVYRIYGDEWRIDAQFLKWKSWATVFGLNAMYRIERLSGRYTNIEDETTKHHSAHEIKHLTTVDFTKLAERYDRKLPFVDTIYGSSAYKKMQSETLFTVFRTQSGILVREQDAATDKYQSNCINEQSAWQNAIMRMDRSLASMVHALQVMPN